MVGKFVYITTGSGARQIAQIEAVDTVANLLLLDREFPIPIVANNQFVLYNDLVEQIWYPQLRK
jgi:hypothetical protein